MSRFFKNIFLNFVIFILSLLLFAVTLSLAQEKMGKGRISGTVVDENGQPLEGVLVVVESPTTKTRLQGYSDKKGHFAVAGMGTGIWQITASKKGYNSSYVDMDVKQLTRNPPINFTLKKMTGFAAFLVDDESLQLFDRGNSMINEGKYDEALAAFDDFMKKYPEIYQVHLNIGSCYLKKGDLDKAVAEFMLVLDKITQTLGDYKKDTATSFRAFTGLGDLYIQKGDFESAQKYFAKALEISPQDEVAAYNVGEVYFSHQKIDEAIKFFELATTIKKDWSKPYLKLGYVYLNKGDFEKSLENFRKFVEMDPQNPEVPKVKEMIATIEKIKK